MDNMLLYTGLCMAYLLAQIYLAHCSDIDLMNKHSLFDVYFICQESLY